MGASTQCNKGFLNCLLRESQCKVLFSNFDLKSLYSCYLLLSLQCLQVLLLLHVFINKHGQIQNDINTHACINVLLNLVTQLEYPITFSNISYLI